MRNHRLALASLTLVVVTACGGAGPVGIAKAAVPRASADPAAATEAGTAIDAFAFDLFRAAVPAGSSGVVSPASIVLALAMARTGAAGETAAQMDAVLHGVAADANADWLNALSAALADRTGTFKDQGGTDQPVTLRLVDEAFAQKDITWEQAYLAALKSRFDAGVRLVDFAADPEAARQAINAWVKDATEQRIPELLAKGVIDQQTALVLVNAIYLRAAWQTAFPEASTKPASFTRADGSTVLVPTMHVAADMRYASGPGWEAVEIPYVGGSLALDIVLPDDTAAFEATLDGTAWTRVAGAFQDASVTLSLPKFGLETATDLAEVLKALGMPDAFDAGRADFSGMTAAERLVITAVIHQANIDVDEKGTTAAAATAVVMGRTSLPTLQVTMAVDHPFLFVLRDVPTGTILFMGRVMEPAVRG
jgi:serine protease inhibitor